MTPNEKNIRKLVRAPRSKKYKWTHGQLASVEKDGIHYCPLGLAVLLAEGTKLPEGGT